MFLRRAQKSITLLLIQPQYWLGPLGVFIRKARFAQ
jgi:hypothetical protein